MSDPSETGRPRTELPWEIAEVESAPSYDEYFSNVVDYGYSTFGSGSAEINYITGGNLKDHRLTYEDPHLYLENCEGKRLWEVATISDLRVVLYDDQWIYAIEAGTDLFRMDYYGESKEILFIDETGLINELNTTFFLADGKVMYFFAGDTDGGAEIHRLYLPEFKLDTLYRYDGAALESFFFAAPETYEQLLGKEDVTASHHIGTCFPVSNHEVIWSSYNREYYELINQLRADPELSNKYFGDASREFSEHIGFVEAEYKVLHQTEHYYNSLTTRYCSRNIGGYTSGGGNEIWWEQ